MAPIRTVVSACRALGLAVGLLTPSALQAQAAAAPAEASRHFERGYLLAQQGSLEEAIAEFKRAYALQPHPSVLYNLGQAYAASGRAVQAADALQRFLAESPAGDTERRAQAAALMEYQSQRIGSVLLSVSPAGAAVSVDGSPVGVSPLVEPIRLTAGLHAVVVELAGYRTRAVAVQIDGKHQASLSISIARELSLTRARNAAFDEGAFRGLQRERRSRAAVQRTGAIVAAGVGLASLTVASIIYVANQSAYDDWQRDSQRLAGRLGRSPAPTAGELDQLLARENSLRNRDAAALGLGVFGGVMAASGAALWFTLPRAEPSRVSLRLGLEPWLGYAETF